MLSLMGSLTTHPNSSKFISMKRPAATLCLTLAVFLGSLGMSASVDFQKGLSAYGKSDYATALREWKPLVAQGDVVEGLLIRKC